MHRFLPILALLGLLTGIRPALALESARVTTPQVTASLVSDSDRAAAGDSVHVGLLLRLAPGWHVYWKNPGQAGLAPDLKLDLPAGATAGPIAWPAPERLKEGPLVVYAYSGRVLLSVPVTASPGRPGLPIRAEADWLVCKDICVPQQGRFTLDLAAGTPTPSAEAPLFAAASRAVPRTAPWHASIAPNGTLSVLGPELGPSTVRRAMFVPDEEGAIADGAAQPLSTVVGGLALSLKPGNAFHPGRPLSGVLILHDGAGLESAVAIDARPGPVPTMFARPGAELWRLWLLALAGGAVLNLMPCVFPVLAMKVLALAGAGNRRGAHGLSYATGVLASFAALGGALMLARQWLGGGAGWGFQFTSPAFVAATCWVMLAIGLNLSGAFRIGAGRLAGAGQGISARGGALGSFATGVLAVLVATPCTAPFMAAAVAGAMTAPPAASLSVFLMMGLGLALPYLALAWSPGLARRLPKPGRWMERLRRVLALPMYATAAWLLWVLSAEAGTAGLLAGAAGLVMVGLAGWAFGATQDARRGVARLGGGGAAVLLAASLALLPGIGSVSASSGAPAILPAGAEPFTPAQLAALRGEGRPVFVDMTASWCLTCLVNERVALDAEPVRRAFREHGVALLVGDWTRQDPALSAFLRANGRDGVPLYLYFPPGGKTPAVLPQILTPGIVVSALQSRR